MRIVFLRLALDECKDNKIAESINLQIEFHIKQQQIIKIKEISYSKYTKNLENLQRRMQKATLQEADALQVRFTPPLPLPQNIIQNNSLIKFPSMLISNN